ncbi:hypothetical protein H0H92_013607 [Tricholoma furcatifolium]|nr:hypothetical protein H0H92_013607 [Tricholoma furcatifolium]
MDGHLNPRSSGRVILVDTPGFNDSPRGDAENVQRLARFLATPTRTVLAGVLYIYEITQDRLPANDGYMNPSKFSRVPSSRHVLLTTVKWSDLRSRAQGEERQERMSTEWSHIYDDGARIVQFNDTQESAREIVNHLCLHTTSIDVLNRDLAKMMGASSGTTQNSRPNSRPGSANGDRLREPGCFSSLFRSRNTY